MIVNICGRVEDRKVWLDGRPLRPEKSQKVWNHSPDGFAWGYEGSGPAQLALAILLALTDERTAVVNYQRLKRDVIARLPVDEDFDCDVDVSPYLEIRQESLFPGWRP